MNKHTKNIPKLTIRETETIKRFNSYHECSEMMRQFFYLGFKSFPALKAIVQCYYPNVDVMKLKWVWNMQVLSPEIKEMLEDIYEKLKQE